MSDIVVDTMPGGGEARGPSSRITSAAIRAAVSGAAFLALFWVSDLTAFAAAFKAVNPAFLIAALALVVVQIMIATLRWHILLRHVGIEHGIGRTFLAYVAGALAGAFMLGSIGNMSARAWVLTRGNAGLEGCLQSLILERIFVFAALFLGLLFGICILFDGEPSMLVLAELERLGRWLPPAAAALVAAGGILIYRVARVRDFARGLMAHISAFLARPARFAVMNVISVVVLFSGFGAVALLARGLGLDVSLLSLIAVQPVVALVASLPISVGGWGVREGGMVVSLSVLHVAAEQAVVLSILYGLVGLAALVMSVAVAMFAVDARKHGG